MRGMEVGQICILHVGGHPAEVVVTGIGEVSHVMGAIAWRGIAEHVVVCAQGAVALEREFDEVGIALVSTNSAPGHTDACCLEGVAEGGVNSQGQRDHIELIQHECCVHARNVVANLVVLSHCKVLVGIIVGIVKEPLIYGRRHEL